MKNAKCVVSEYGYSVAAGVATLSLKTPVVKDQTQPRPVADITVTNVDKCRVLNMTTRPGVDKVKP